MEVVKYKKEDTIPVVLMILRFLEEDFCTWAMRVGLEDEFSDLQGLIDEIDFGDSGFEMLGASKNETIKQLLLIASKFQERVHWYANLFSLHLPEIYEDLRIVELGTTFYNYLIYDEQIEDEEDRNTNHRDTHLLMFVFSTLDILFRLRDLVAVGEVDLDEDYYSFRDGWGLCMGKYENAEEYEVKMLVSLLVDVLDGNDALIAML